MRKSIVNYLKIVGVIMPLDKITVDEIMHHIYPVLKDTFGYVPVHKAITVCEAVQNFITTKFIEENRDDKISNRK